MWINRPIAIKDKRELDLAEEILDKLPDTLIEWENNEREWQITSVKQSGVIATCNDTNDYPLGTHVWYFEDQLCSEPGKSFRLLNLQGCSEGQVSCRNGDCVPIESRSVFKMTNPDVKNYS